MSTRNKPRNWNDVQTTIATVAIVTTLGMWNIFATPVKKESTSTEQPLPPTEAPTVEPDPTQMPQVTIIFATPIPTQAVISAQPQQPQVANKNKNKNNNGTGKNKGNGSGTVTKTKSS